MLLIKGSFLFFLKSNSSSVIYSGAFKPDLLTSLSLLCSLERFRLIVYGIAGLNSGTPRLARGGASITSEVFPRFEILI